MQSSVVSSLQEVLAISYDEEVFLRSYVVHNGLEHTECFNRGYFCPHACTKAYLNHSSDFTPNECLKLQKFNWSLSNPVSAHGPKHNKWRGRKIGCTLSLDLREGKEDLKMIAEYL